MKKIDENYSYDELEGFEPINPRVQASKSEYWLSMFKNVATFSAVTRETLFVRPYIRFAYNAQK